MRGNMRIVIAMDSFKGSMTSLEAGNAAKEGILERIPEAQVVVKPLADGGEGTLQALLSGLDAELISVEVQDPLGRAVTANYAIVTGPGQEKQAEGSKSCSGKTAIIEMAQAAGLTLLSEEERNPNKTSTFGVGQMICDALERGCRDFIVGIGGSATNDGGIGMLRALGFRFYEKRGECVQNLKPDVNRIDGRFARPELEDCTFRIACDVNNPLCGENGATFVYAGQKGLQPEEFGKTDLTMKQYAAAVARYTGKDLSCVAGAGAAGGMGFAFLSFLHGVLVPGAELAMQVTGLADCLREADVFLTGEGRMDGQTSMGKAPWIAACEAKYINPECRVYALTGQRSKEIQVGGEGAESIFDGVWVITPSGMSEVEAMQTKTAKENMRRTASELIDFELKRRE